MKQYFTEFDSGNDRYLNFNSDAEAMATLEKLAKKYFAGNPECSVYLVAAVDFDTREHYIIEFEVKTTFNITKY